MQITTSTKLAIVGIGYAGGLPILERQVYLGQVLQADPGSSMDGLPQANEGLVIEVGRQDDVASALLKAKMELASGVVVTISAPGFIAITLKKYELAHSAGDRVYAVIAGVASANQVTEACRQAFILSGVSAGQVGYLEVCTDGSGKVGEDQAAGLVNAYRGSDTLNCALGFTRLANPAGRGAASLAAIARAALCLYNRLIPAMPEWAGQGSANSWSGSAFYIPQESRTWFALYRSTVTPPEPIAPRCAAVCLTGTAGDDAHIILCEDIQTLERPNFALTQRTSSPMANFFFFPASAGSLPTLIEDLERCKSEIAASDHLTAAARQRLDRFQTHGGDLTAVILGRHKEELQKEIDLALKNLPAAYEKKAEWQTPAGSYFTSAPLGKNSGIAFVYPGAFNSYIGLARDLFTLFPQLHEHVTTIVSDPGAALQERIIYPRSLSPLTQEEQKQLEAQLSADPIAMLTSGTIVSALYTAVLRQVFDIHPQAAFGYSLGENSMLFATGVWTNGDEASSALHASPLFRTRLAGAQNAVREYWNLPPLETAPANPQWVNYLLMASPDAVLDALQTEPRVYMTHINTPRQVVIAGDQEGCQRVIAALKCAHLRAPFNFALHCNAMKSEFQGLADQHDWEVRQKPNIQLYSAADYQPLKLERAVIARKIGRALCTCLDFPRLVNQVYYDGARLFIELGAGSNCARWVDETLKGQPHTAISINRQGVDDFTSILRLLARLVSHGVQMNLNSLYN